MKLQEKQCQKQGHGQILSQSKLVQKKWVGIKAIDCVHKGKNYKNYEVAYRTTTKKDQIAGVNVLPIIKYKEKQTEIVFIANFRPAVNKFVLEFPAGLVEDQNYLENAKRQLKQQTGMIASRFIEIPIPRNYCDPWKSDQCGIMFLGIIDGDDPSAISNQQLEAEENIRVCRMPLNGDLAKNVSEFAEKNNYVIEGKVWCISLGVLLSMSKIL